MTTAEKNEINERIANLRSSRKDIGCENCDKGFIYIETDSWGITFKACPHCSGEASKSKGVELGINGS